MYLVEIGDGGYWLSVPLLMSPMRRRCYQVPDRS